MACVVVLGFSNCVTFVQVEKVKNMQEDFITKIGASKKIGIVANENKKHSKSEYGEYVSSMEAGAKDGFLQNKYFATQEMMDRSGLFKLLDNKQYSSVQNTFSIGVLYLMNTTPIKNILCNLSSVTRYRQGQCTNWARHKDGSSTCQQYEQIPYQVNISKITFQFQIEGKLINLKNGNSIQLSSKPDYTISREGSLCTADNSGLKHFFSNAAYSQSLELAKAISPISELYTVKLYKDLDGIPDTKENKELRNQVGDILAEGLKDIRNMKFDEGEKKFLEANQISNQKSAAALWNLGVLAWRKMDLALAYKYLSDSIAFAGEWKTPLRTEIVNLVHEQMRILQPQKQK